MPELIAEAVAICPMWASNFEVLGSEDKRYLVQFHKIEPAMCNCPAYQYSGDYGEQHCKHIDRVFANGCFYHPDIEDRSKTWNEFNFDDNGVRWLSSGGHRNDPPLPCPGCGSPMVIVKVAV